MGRPKGILETKPRNTVAKKVAAQAAQRGITPLEVMLTAMREDWTAAQKMLADAVPQSAEEALAWTGRIQNLRASAIATADKVAPYLHARLSATTISGDPDNPLRFVDDRAPVDTFLTEFAGTTATTTATKH